MNNSTSLFASAIIASSVIAATIDAIHERRDSVFATQVGLIAARRDSVIKSYDSAKSENHLRFMEGDVKATEQYIYPNQIEDAMNIVDLFYREHRRVISIQKKTKVGADGLMIELAKLLTTHIDDNFVVNPTNVRILTGMSNAGWEKDMKEKSPSCFKDKIFHHGKLSKADIINIKNGLFIIDEIDSGDKEHQVLHNILKEAGVLDVKHMEENNNRFIFISATMIRELYDLYRWGNLHALYKMTIPDSYIGHQDFLKMRILQVFYPLNTQESSEKWIQEDIIDNYGTDYRVHIVRVKKNIIYVQNACIRKGVIFRNHTSTDRISHEEINELFIEPLKKHIVIGVIGFFRRANLIPNRWKLRIGATHELHTKKIDNNVQIQGLTGRMTGYWRDDIERGFKTGPHRTSIRAIEEYEKTYNDPFGPNSYQTAGFKKKKGEVTSQPTMLSPQNIKNLDAVRAPAVTCNRRVPFVIPIPPGFDSAQFCGTVMRHDEKITSIREIVRNVTIFRDEEMLEEVKRTISEILPLQITAPNTEESYKKNIIATVEAFSENRTYGIGQIPSSLSDAVESNTCWQCYIDVRCNRICILWQVF